MRISYALDGFRIMQMPTSAGKSSKPNALSHRPDVAPAPGEKLIFGKILKLRKITELTFAEVAKIAEFESCLEDESIDFADAEQ